MTRLQKLSSSTLTATVLLVAIGGFTRGSGSGYGCADRWPLCEGGAFGGLLPRAEFHMVVEWTHRWFAAIAVGLLAATAVHAWRRYPRERALTWGATAGLVGILAQAGLGAAVVKTGLKADLVSVHLALALGLLGVLTFLTVTSFAAGTARAATTAPERRWSRLLAGGAGGIYGVAMLGSLVHDQFVGGWPLVGGRLVPAFASRLITIHFTHRVVAGLVFAYLAWLAARVVARRRPRAEVAFVHAGLALYTINVGLGAAHVFTAVSSSGLVVAHLLVASLSWSALVAAATVAHRAGRVVAEEVGPLASASARPVDVPGTP